MEKRYFKREDIYLGSKILSVGEDFLTNTLFNTFLYLILENSVNPNISR